MSLHCLSSVVVLLVLSSGAVLASDAEPRFYKAYYLETEEGDLEGAVEIYRQIEALEGASPEWVARAKKRRRGAEEEIRSRDLARLMPPAALGYIEIRQPGEHAARLLELTGLADFSGELSDELKLPVEISPRLIESFKKVSGVAAALTDFNPLLPIPEGVVVINAGRSDLLHGLVETLLSGAASASALLIASEPIHGHATYVAPLCTVAVTQRLIVVSTLR